MSQSQKLQIRGRGSWAIHRGTESPQQEAKAIEHDISAMLREICLTLKWKCIPQAFRSNNRQPSLLCTAKDKGGQVASLHFKRHKHQLQGRFSSKGSCECIATYHHRHASDLRFQERQNYSLQSKMQIHFWIRHWNDWRHPWRSIRTLDIPEVSSKALDDVDTAQVQEINSL